MVEFQEVVPPHTNTRLAFVSLILYAECNEFRVLSQACELTELTMLSCTMYDAFSCLLLFLPFLCFFRLHFHVCPPSCRRYRTWETIKLRVSCRSMFDKTAWREYFIVLSLMDENWANAMHKTILVCLLYRLSLIPFCVLHV